jgi:hypothetical protein
MVIGLGLSHLSLNVGGHELAGFGANAAGLAAIGCGPWAVRGGRLADLFGQGEVNVEDFTFLRSISRVQPVVTMRQSLLDRILAILATVAFQVTLGSFQARQEVSSACSPNPTRFCRCRGPFPYWNFCLKPHGKNLRDYRF